MQNSPRLRVSLLVLLVLAPGLSGLKIARQTRVSPLQLRVSRSDFDDYFQAARKLSQGEDPYRTEQMEELSREEFQPGDIFDPEKLARLARAIRGVGTYLYPPFTAFLLLPLTALSYETAAILFQLLSPGALVLFLYHLYRRNASLDRPRSLFEMAALGSLLLLSNFLMENSNNGNVGFFLILLTGSGLLFAFRREPALEWAGGFLLGVAAVMKISPGFLGLVLIAGFRVRAIGGMGLGALFALLVPSLAFGFQENFHLLDNWRILILERYGEHGFVRPWVNNQSLSGAIGKLFIPGSDMKQGQYGLPFLFSDRLPTEGEFAFFVNLLRFLNLSLVALGLGVAGVLGRRERSGRFRALSPEDPRFSRILFLAVSISLLVSGVSWFHAFSALFVPLYFRLHSHLSGRAPLERSEWISLFFLGFFGLAQGALSSHAREWLAIHSLFTFGMLIITGVMARLSVQEGGYEDGI